MATKLTTVDSSVGGGQAAALELAQNLMRGSSEVGEARAVARNIECNLQNEELPLQTYEMARDLAHQVSQLMKRIGTFEESIGSAGRTSFDALARNISTTQFEISELVKRMGTFEESIGSAVRTSFDALARDVLTTQFEISKLVKGIGRFEESIGSDDLTSFDALARMILTTQFEAFKEQVEGLKGDSSYPLRNVKRRASGELKKMLPVFEKHVGQYLQTRSQKDLDQARRSHEDVARMSRAVTDLSDFETQLAGREVEYHEDSPTDKRIRALSNLIGGGFYYGGNYETVMQRLDALVAEGSGQEELENKWGFNKERINETIDQLHKEVGSDQVNYWVWKLSGEKPGENYGVAHRYDDLGILKEAILRTTKSLADKIMKEEAQGLDKGAVFKKLFEAIGEPQVENPMEWMKQNACYYTEDLKAAIQEVKFPRRQFDVFEDFDPLPSQFNFNASSSSFSSSMPIRVEPQKHEYTQIIDELAELGQEEVPSKLKGQIEQMVADLSKNGLGNTINFEVWRLGGEKPGDNWGEVHRYDNPAVLRQALMIAVRRDVHEQFVVKNFADEEDCNAFYAEIGRMAYALDFDSDPADLVAYGKEHIVFHLHELDRAKKDVEARIEERREAKVRESEEALVGLIEAAIAKNPAAQSIADMLELINQSTGYFAQTGADEECKAQIRERIEASSFDSALKKQIFLGIWTANNKPLGDSKYGDKHYLDDLKILREVLLNILVEIGINDE